MSGVVAGLLGSIEAVTARLSLSLFLPVGVNSSWGDFFWHLVWHASTKTTAELGSWDQVHAKLQQFLGPGEQTGALTVAAVPVSEVWMCADLPWSWGLGLQGLLQWLARRVGNSSSKGPRRTVIAPAYFSTVILFQKSSNIFIIVFRSILRKTTILLILVLQCKYQTISFIM